MSLYESDVLGVADDLTANELSALSRLRRALESSIAPVLADHWERGEFPLGAFEALVAADAIDPDGPERSLYAGFRNLELARTDASVATFYNAQSGLFRTAIRLGGSDRQFAEWDPLVTSFRRRGVFALTEPDHGSDIARGLATTAEQTDSGWIVSGTKRWIGGARTADILAVFARDVADGAVKAFLVPADAEGITITPMRGKTALRIMPNDEISLDHVEVDKAARLPRVESFADVARMLGAMRSGVAWLATGLQFGAYESALGYARTREQFGSAIGGFQLVQEKLARMLANVTSSLTVAAQLSRQQDAGVWNDANSALAKMWCASRARETAALAREIVGGNGILLEHDVARFFADAEAVYSYEGTHDINALVVGRSITGLSAFR